MIKRKWPDFYIPDNEIIVPAHEEYARAIGQRVVGMMQTIESARRNRDMIPRLLGRVNNNANPRNYITHMSLIRVLHNYDLLDTYYSLEDSDVEVQFTELGEAYEGDGWQVVMRREVPDLSGLGEEFNYKSISISADSEVQNTNHRFSLSYRLLG